MGLLALVCAVLLVILIPNEIWAVLFYLAAIAVVAVVGWFALVMWLISIT